MYAGDHIIIIVIMMIIILFHSYHLPSSCVISSVVLVFLLLVLFIKFILVDWIEYYFFVADIFNSVVGILAVEHSRF